MKAERDKALCLNMSSICRHAAATVIQCSVRLRLARCKTHRLRIQKVEKANAERLKILREQASAVQVQRAYRRYRKNKLITRIKLLGGGFVLHYRLSIKLFGSISHPAPSSQFAIGLPACHAQKCTWNFVYFNPLKELQALLLR